MKNKIYIFSALVLAFSLSCTKPGTSVTPDPGPDPTPVPQPDPQPDPQPAVSVYPVWFELPEINDADKDGIDDKNKDYHYAVHTFEYGGKRVRNFSVCMSAEQKDALWVAAPLHSFYEQKNCKRSNAYQYDPDIPSGIQHNGVGSNSGTGFNRGHLLGSADRLVCIEANHQVFYSSNIVPQGGNFNTGGGAWNNLEEKIASYVASDTTYVVIGCYYDDFTDSYGVTNKAEKITYCGEPGVGVPTMLYYAILRTKKGNTGKSLKDCKADEMQCAAFVLRQNMTKGHKPEKKDMMTVSALEKLTGFKYFPNVPVAPKGNFSASDWGL